MKEIGGYFGLELDKGRHEYHSTSYKFQSGRAALSFILQHARPAKVYVPFYTCDALLEPFAANDVTYEFYSIDQNFEIARLPQLHSNELFIYVNYYDIKRSYVEKLSAAYKDKLVVDCTQSYFLKGNNKSWYFNSVRKFFGVPDGADLYVPEHYDLSNEYAGLADNEDYITNHLLYRFNGHTQDGYSFFQENEKLNGNGIKKMSKLGNHLISHIRFDKARKARKKNFTYLHKKLKQTNLLQINDDEEIVPNFYPYLSKQTIPHKTFWDNKIFVPVLWNDCLNRKPGVDFSYEKKLSSNLLPLPVDHRYNKKDMNTIFNLILQQNERTG